MFTYFDSPNFYIILYALLYYYYYYYTEINSLSKLTKVFQSRFVLSTFPYVPNSHKTWAWRNPGVRFVAKLTSVGMREEKVEIQLYNKIFY